MIDHAASLSADDRLDIHDVERRVKAIFIGSVGNLVEWYDFYAYTAFALYFAPAFFPNSDPVVQQLNAAVLFAATFLMRPLGGWLFGYIADRHGRRLSLTLSVVCMCFGSLIIAVTPTYASIGIAAPAILAIARVSEGLSRGGEYGASATYLSEVADAKHRGFYSSFQYVTLIGGQLTAIIVLLLLQKVFLTQQELQEWGWRIPFVIGALLAVFAAVMRRNLHETEAFEEASKIARPTGSIVGLLKYPRELLLVVGLTAGGTAAFYTFTTYMQTFVRLSVGLTADQTPGSPVKNHVYRSDKFSPKSFVTHAAALASNELDARDLLPRLANKVLVTKELAPIFRGREEELQSNFSVLISVLDGKGFTSDSGMRGQRGYDTPILFNWLGATTPLPPTTHRMMAQLGTRLLFYEVPAIEPTEEQLMDYAEKDDAGEAEVECQKAVNSFLADFFSRHPVGSYPADDMPIPEELLRQIVRWAKLLAHGRAEIKFEKVGPDWRPVAVGTPEGPFKIVNYLKEIARGHAHPLHDFADLGTILFRGLPAKVRVHAGAQALRKPFPYI